jgi:5'-nucleotidase
LHTGDLAAQTVAVDNNDNPCTLRLDASTSSYFYSSASSGSNHSSECIGGMPRLKTAIEAARADAASASSPVVLLDVGNMFQSAYDTGSLVLITYQDEAVSDLMGAMDYDAVHFNYREYLLGFQPLAYFVGNMTARGVAVVEANLDWAGQREFANLTISPFVTFDLTSAGGGGSELVGYTAGIDGDLAKLLSTPENTSAWDEVAGIRSAVGAMQNIGVNKIIVSVSSTFVLDSGNPPRTNTISTRLFHSSLLS